MRENDTNIVPSRTEEVHECKPCLSNEVFESSQEQNRATGKNELKKVSSVRRSLESCKDSLRGTSLFSVVDSDTSTTATRLLDDSSQAFVKLNNEQNHISRKTKKSVLQLKKETQQLPKEKKKKTSKRNRFYNRFFVRRRDTNGKNNNHAVGDDSSILSPKAQEGLSQPPQDLISKTAIFEVPEPSSTESEQAGPSFENLQKLSYALKKLHTINDNHLLYEDGQAVYYEMAKLLEQEVAELVAASKLSPNCTSYDEKVEDVLQQFQYMFSHLSVCINGSLRSKTLTMGTKMRDFRDSLISSSISFKDAASLSMKELNRSKNSLSLSSDEIIAEFASLSLKWAEEAPELEESYARCKLLYHQTTRAYFAFFNWNCSLYLKPNEGELFHDFHGITHYRRSCELLFDKDLYALLHDGLGELRDSLNYLLSKRFQLLGN